MDRPPRAAAPRVVAESCGAAGARRAPRGAESGWSGPPRDPSARPRTGGSRASARPEGDDAAEGVGRARPIPSVRHDRRRHHRGGDAARGVLRRRRARRDRRRGRGFTNALPRALGRRGGLQEAEEAQGAGRVDAAAERRSARGAAGRRRVPSFRSARALSVRGPPRVEEAGQPRARRPPPHAARHHRHAVLRARRDERRVKSRRRGVGDGGGRGVAVLQHVARPRGELGVAAPSRAPRGHSRVAAAGASRTFRGDGSRRRRGGLADVPRGRVAAAPQSWTFRGGRAGSTEP